MYTVAGTESLVTPALLVFADLTRRNLDQMLQVAGGPGRLRPHCKTHKMPALTRWWLERGVAKHKCATFAEAEMLAREGVPDILLAYSIVGANVDRVVRFRAEFPDVRLAVLVDDAPSLKRLDQALAAAGRSVDALLDLATGLGRTGIEPGDEAVGLYGELVDAEQIRAAGLHWYDGHLHQSDMAERRSAVLAGFQAALELRERLRAEGMPVDAIVAGGTGSFPIYAELEDESIELSPGSCVFHDIGYGAQFPEMDFTPSALILTRVISRPGARRLTLDLGYKGVASDVPLERRLAFPELPDARPVLQNEEHLVLETESAERFRPGDELLAIPGHICPTCNLYREAVLIESGRPAARWEITAGARRLTI